MTDQTAHQEHHQEEQHCPNCGKLYRPRIVNAADYRIDYSDLLGASHVCAACWYGRPSGIDARRIVTDRDETAAGLQLANAIAAAVYGTRGEYR